MDKATKDYINRLNIECIPWHRMFTAYGTAENYDELLSVLEQTLDVDEWNKAFNRISDFEHQSTMFPPAPFALVFLVRILKKLLNCRKSSANIIAKKLIHQFTYYAEICNDAEKEKHAPPLDNFSEMLDEQYLLSENFEDSELEEIFENPDSVPDELFYSFYYYSKVVLSQVPDILAECGGFTEESEKLKTYFDK